MKTTPTKSRWHRTPKEHTTYIRTFHKGYVCLRYISARDDNTYKHQECGYVFQTTVDKLRVNVTPCPRCRSDSFAKYQRRIDHLKDVVIAVRKTENGILHRFVECGHEEVFDRYRLLRSNLRHVCHTCNPAKNSWIKTTIKGKRFTFRSSVEADFVQHLLRKGVRIHEIEHEPACKIQYKHPDGTIRSYLPDFRVQGVLVEVKDLSSLGLRFYHYMDQGTALLENRAKVLAAQKEHSFALFVRIRGEFIRAHRFWTQRERSRLLDF